MRHVILDTDIGTDVDYLLALVFLAHARELSLKGVTTVYGDTLLRAIMFLVCPVDAKRVGAAESALATGYRKLYSLFVE